MTQIDKQTVTKIAKLARLHVEEADKEALAKELSGIFKFVEQLGTVDTKNVQAMTGVEAMSSAMRADEVTDGGIKEDLLKNAPDAEYGFSLCQKWWNK